MLQSGKKDPIAKKAYEIAYALCRIGDGIKNEAFGKILTQKGVELLCMAVGHENGKIAGIISGLEYLVQLGTDVGCLGQSNAATLLAEFAELLNAVAGEEMDQGDTSRHATRDIDISDIFSSSLDADTESAQSNSSNEDIVDDGGNEEKEKWFGKKGIRIIDSEPILSVENGRDIEEKFSVNEDTAIPRLSVDGGNDSGVPLSESAAPPESGNIDSSNGGFSTSISSDIRQSAILNRIRQSGNCRIRDLQDLFPNWSERTLRYDIESLTARKLVERVGGGSATYYQLVAG
jgi:hypothetical protein